MVLAEPFWAFLAISAVVIVTPGQDTALTIRNTLAGGRKSDQHGRGQNRGEVAELGAHRAPPSRIE